MVVKSRRWGVSVPGRQSHRVVVVVVVGAKRGRSLYGALVRCSGQSGVVGSSPGSVDCEKGGRIRRIQFGFQPRFAGQYFHLPGQCAPVGQVPLRP